MMSDNREMSPARAVDAMPEAFVSKASISSEVSRRVADGRLRKLASRLYTRNLGDAPRAIVRRNLWSIVSGYFPGALVADRTALELQPASDGSVCLVSAHGADITLPGVILRPRRGAPPQKDDQPFMNQELYLSSQARAYLDNLCASRRGGGKVPRTLARMDIEARLERLMASAGIDACNRLRDDARRISEGIGRTEQRAELDRIVGALAGTGDAQLRAPSAQARARGRAYDSRRVALFENLFTALRQTAVRRLRPRPRDGIGNATFAFFEAYFSNYIAGLRAISSGHSVAPFVRMLDFARRWTAAMTWGPLDQTQERLHACNAFDSEAELEAQAGWLFVAMSPTRTMPGSTTLALMPRRLSCRPRFELTKRVASTPNRAENFWQPVCGTAVTSTTASPSRRRVPGGRFSSARSRST